MKSLLIILFIITFAFVVFSPSFSLGFFGDDWLIFFINKYLHNSNSHISYLEHFLTRYGSQAIIMAGLKNLFGFQPGHFYLTSFLFKITATLSLYPLTFYLTKNRLASFTGMLFFAITLIGLQTTEYLPHIPSYISITFFNFFLYFFLKSRDEGKNTLALILSGIFFYFTFIFAPIRMTGLIPFILVIEIFWFLQNRTQKVLKQALTRIGVILLVFLFINITGHPFFYLYQTGQTLESANSSIFSDTLTGFNIMINFLMNGRFDFLFYPLITFGNMFLPDNLASYLLTHIGGFQTVVQLIVVYTIFLTFIFFLKKNISELNNKFVLILGFVWTLLAFAIFLINKVTFPTNGQLTNLLLGGYTLIIITNLLQKHFKNSLTSTALFTSISWAFLSFFGPWLWAPTTIFPTDQRYIVVSGSGIALLLATLISISKRKTFIIPIIFLMIIIHAFASYSYLNNILNRHSQDVSQKIWSSMPIIPEVKTGSLPTLFYFIGDGTNENIIHDVITYGFPPHMDILYNLDNPEGRNLPQAISEWKDVISAVTDGNIMVAFGYPKKPVSINQIYAFKLKNNNLIDVTTLIRDQLAEEIESR